MARILQVVNSESWIEWCKAFCLSGAVFLWAIAFTVLAGCSGGLGAPAEKTVIQPRVFSVIPELEPAFRAAAARVTAASGIELDLGPDGLPVVLTDNPPPAPDSGLPLCAATLFELEGSAQLIELAADPAAHGMFCADQETTLVHELIHALAPEAQHLAGDTRERVFEKAAYPGSMLEVLSLSELCSHADCTVFQPE